MRTTPTFEKLESDGTKLGSEYEGTIIHYNYQGIEYTALQDNTVVLKSDWDKE